jgi:hypothetical protein
MRTTLLRFAVLCFVTSVLPGKISAQAPNQPDVSLTINARMAEVIVVARLSAAPRPLEERSVRKYFRIESKEILKGELAPNSLLVVNPGLWSTVGRPAEIDENCDYLLFLDHSDTKTAVPAFSICEVWHGLVALSPDAKDQRAAGAIKTKYGMDMVKDRKRLLSDVKNHGKLPPWRNTPAGLDPKPK